MPISKVFNVDCLKYMKNIPDKYFDLAIVDPPYWINSPNMNMGGNRGYISTAERVGCIVCPKANLNSNYFGLMRYPKLVDCFIYAREKAKQNGAKIDWIITSDNKDYSNDKVYYICRWLNHSFMQFTAKQEKLYLKFREKYDLIHNKNNNL